MTVLRNINLQRAIGILVLFTALFSQIQTLYACESMEGKPKHVCCCGEYDSVSCPMAENCALHENALATPCCEVSYDVMTDTAMINSVSTVDSLVLLLDGPQPPPFIEFQGFSSTPLPVKSRLIHPTNEPLILSRGKYTYLLTRRLRI